MLRSWGEGLSTSDRDELRAAGRAILMLIEEIDRLEADIWNERAAAVQAAGEQQEDELDLGVQGALDEQQRDQEDKQVEYRVQSHGW